MTAWEVTGALVALVALLTLVDRVRGLAPGQRSTVARALLAAVRAYRRWISPVRPPACRFTPSCSAYAIAALERHGAVRGGWLTTRRLLRCGPWHPGGHDPVPPAVGLIDNGRSGSAPGTRADAPTSTPTGAPPC